MAGRPQTLTPVSDIDFMRSITQEVSDLFFREIEVFPIDREATVVDSLYGESKNRKFRPSFFVRAQVELTPKKAVLTKFGLDEPRDLMINMDAGVLKRGTGVITKGQIEALYSTASGGFPVPDVGDILVVQDEKYEVLDNIKIDYFWHSESNLTYTLMCNRYRGDKDNRSVADEVPVDPVANPTGPTQVPTYTTETDFPGEDS